MIQLITVHPYMSFIIIIGIVCGIVSAIKREENALLIAGAVTVIIGSGLFILRL